jgi:hypothetical protein
MKVLKYLIVCAIGCMTHEQLFAQNFDLQIANFKLSNNSNAVALATNDSMEFDLVNLGTDSFMLNGGSTFMKFYIHVDTNIVQPTPFNYQLLAHDSFLLSAPIFINAGDSVHFTFALNIAPIIFTLYKDNEIVIWPILQPTEPNQNNNSARLFVHCNAFANVIEASQKSEIEIYPNPTNGILKIELPIDSKNYEIEIIDVTGKLMVARKQINNGVVTIQLANYLKNDGIYFVKIKNENKVISKKITFYTN